MVNVQENLIDNKDSLEKKSGTLSIEEKWKLEWIKNNNDVIENARKTEFDIKLKNWKDVKITAETLIKVIAKSVSLAKGTNYKEKLANADIKVSVWGKIEKIENSQLWRWSELMAFLQIAAWWNLSPDWKFVANTALAFSALLDEPKTPTKSKETSSTNFEKVNLNELTTHNFYAEFASLFWDKVANTYKNTYKLFKSTNWTFTFVNNLNGNITIKYTSEHSKIQQSISFKASAIQKANLNIDNQKLLETVKTKIDNNEAKLKKENMKESILIGIEDVEAKAFSPLIQEYLASQWWITAWEIDFHSWIRSSGMEVKWDKLHITYPWKGSGWKNLIVAYKLSDIQTNNQFDQDKFVKLISQRLNPRSKERKKWVLESEYNNLANNNISSISNWTSIYYFIGRYNTLKSNIDKYTNQWVSVDDKIKKYIPVKLEALTNQKNYLIAKNWIDGDIEDFEERNSKKMSRADILKLWKDIESRVSSLEKWTLYLKTSKINIKDAFTKANKTVDYTKYLNRYKALL